MAQEPSPGRLEVHAGADGGSHIRISGAWTLAHFATLDDQVKAQRTQLREPLQLDLDALDALDTVGAGLLSLLLGGTRLHALLASRQDLGAGRHALLQTVGTAVSDVLAYTPAPSEGIGFVALLERLGRTMHGVWSQIRALLGFLGLVLMTLARNLLRPWRWRVTALVAQLEQTTLDALPIVALLAFMVGAVIAFLGATMLSAYGASVFTVDLVSFAFLREFGVLLAAILLAGRTASAFTAQIGAMQSHEEIDALRTLGLDPIEVLVLPRVLALVIGLPMLTLISMLAGLLGGALVCIVDLGIPPAMFLSLLHSDTPLSYFWVGMSKAPLLAFLIAVIGCLEGFKVTGSAESVGERTTSSVVQAIFVVILVDALAALFFMEMGW